MLKCLDGASAVRWVYSISATVNKNVTSRRLLRWATSRMSINSNSKFGVAE